MVLYTPFAGLQRALSQGVGEADPSHGYIEGSGKSPFNENYYHSLDFKAPEGTPMVAMGAGVVVGSYYQARNYPGIEDNKTEAEQKNPNWNYEIDSKGYHGLGNIITIEYDSGEVVTFAHAAENSILHQKGDRVVAGEVVAVVGRTGYIEGIHYHISFGTTVHPLYAEMVDARVGKGGENVKFAFAENPETLLVDATVSSSFTSTSITIDSKGKTDNDDDRTIYTLASETGDLDSKDKEGTTGGDALAGDGGANGLDGRGGADVLSGKGGKDFYGHGIGDGHDIIIENGNAGEIDVLEIYGKGLVTDLSQLKFSKDGHGNLIITATHPLMTLNSKITIGNMDTPSEQVEILRLFNSNNQQIGADVDLVAKFSSAPPQGLTVAQDEQPLAVAGGDGSGESILYPTLSIEPIESFSNKPEGNSGETFFTLKARLSEPAPEDVVFNWGVSLTGTASAADLGSFTSGTSKISAGGTTVNINVPILGDTIAEGNETLGVKIVSASGAAINPSKSVATLVIENDDLAATNSGSENNLVWVKPQGDWTAEGIKGATSHAFFLKRDNPSGETTVDWEVRPRGDTQASADGSDFVGGTFPSGSTTFTGPDSQLDLRVFVEGDNVFEPNEAYEVVLTSVSNGRIDQSRALVPWVITNDDPNPDATQTPPSETPSAEPVAPPPTSPAETPTSPPASDAGAGTAASVIPTTTIVDNAPIQALGSAPFAVGVWFKLEDGGGYLIYGEGSQEKGDLNIYVDGNAILARASWGPHYLHTDTSERELTFHDGKSHYVETQLYTVNNRTFLEMYLDGVKVASNSRDGSYDIPAFEAWRVGESYSVGSTNPYPFNKHFWGEIAEATLFHGRRTANDVMTTLASGPPTPPVESFDDILDRTDLTLIPIEDVTVTNVFHNYGYNTTNLQVGGNGDIYISYMKFAVPTDTAHIVDVDLKLTNNTTKRAETRVFLELVTSEWDESIKWGPQQPSTERLGIMQLPRGQERIIDLSEYISVDRIQEIIDREGEISFAFKPENNSDSWARFESSESSLTNLIPQLIITAGEQTT